MQYYPAHELTQNAHYLTIAFSRLNAPSAAIPKNTYLDYQGRLVCKICLLIHLAKYGPRHVGMEYIKMYQYE